VQHKRHVTVWCCYYSNVDWNWLTGVTEIFIETFHFMMELRVTGTCSMCLTEDHLLLMNFLRMAPSCQNI